MCMCDMSGSKRVRCKNDIFVAVCVFCMLNLLFSVREILVFLLNFMPRFHSGVQVACGEPSQRLVVNATRTHVRMRYADNCDTFASFMYVFLLVFISTSIEELTAKISMKSKHTR